MVDNALVGVVEDWAFVAVETWLLEDVMLLPPPVEVDWLSKLEDVPVARDVLVVSVEDD